MKRCIIILLVGILVTANGIWAQIIRTKPSKPLYTDDSYYWHTLDTVVPASPVYDKNAREFIFLEDTTLGTDTVVMRIINK